MAAGTVTDWTSLAPFNATRVRALTENVALFGSASSANAGNAPAITLDSGTHLGYVETGHAMKMPGDALHRRDPTSMAAVPYHQIGDISTANIKVHSRIGPFLETHDKFIKVGLPISTQAVEVGRWFSDVQLRDMANSAFASAIAAIQGMTDTPMVHNVAGRLTQKELIKAQRKFGDQAGLSTTLLGQSGAYYDVMEDNYDKDKANVAGIVIERGGNPTLGLPFVVTDNASLIDEVNGKLYTLMLKSGGIRVKQSEGAVRFSTVSNIHGFENIAESTQGEHAYTVALDGVKWNVTNGGEIATDEGLAAPANWSFLGDSPKESFGILIVSDIDDVPEAA